MWVKVHHKQEFPSLPTGLPGYQPHSVAVRNNSRVPGTTHIRGRYCCRGSGVWGAGPDDGAVCNAAQACRRCRSWGGHPPLTSSRREGSTGPGGHSDSTPSFLHIRPAPSPPPAKKRGGGTWAPHCQEPDALGQLPKGRVGVTRQSLASRTHLGRLSPA